MRARQKGRRRGQRGGTASLPKRDCRWEQNPGQTNKMEQPDTDASHGRGSSSSGDEPSDNDTRRSEQPPSPESQHVQTSDRSEVHEAEATSDPAPATTDPGSAATAPPVVQRQTNVSALEDDTMGAKAWWLDTKRAAVVTPPPPAPRAAQLPAQQSAAQALSSQTDPEAYLRRSTAQNGPHNRRLRSPMPISVSFDTKTHCITCREPRLRSDRKKARRDGRKQECKWLCYPWLYMQ